MKISIVILTYNRRDRIANQIKLLSALNYNLLEIIVVDNCSDESVHDIVATDYRAKIVRNLKNLGAVGRNRGIDLANGDIIITLDDDVYGITNNHLYSLCKLMAPHDIAAINFKIKEEESSKLTNWCHPYDERLYSERSFETNEISEGAVAFKKKALNQVGLYPEYFFISHEGPDLALRLINAGWKVIYSPEISVIHAHDKRARPSWRRYYYDTRNVLWLVLRNLSLWYGLKRLFVGWMALLVYSVRDGYFFYWVKAVRDALIGAPRAFRDRCHPSRQAKKRWRQIEKNKPGFFHMVRKRLYSKEVKI